MDKENEPYQHASPVRVGGCEQINAAGIKEKDLMSNQRCLAFAIACRAH
jgi:hypothetical protein